MTVGKSRLVHEFLIWRVARALALAAKGEVESAERLATEAVAYANRIGYSTVWPSTRLELADLLVTSLGEVEAERLLMEALDMWVRKGAPVLADGVRAKIDGIRSR